MAPQVLGYIIKRLCYSFVSLSIDCPRSVVSPRLYIVIADCAKEQEMLDKDFPDGVDCW